MRSAMFLLPLAAMAFSFPGCDRTPALSPPDDLRPASCDFGVYWPPKDPEEAGAKSARALLQGSLNVASGESTDGSATLRLAVTLTRPSEEADREYWNSTLAYSNVAWMEEVRVWDAKHTWLWPNLPYLLRLPGRERVERYGGRDPSKHVDNDFAAVLVRQYDAAGRVESAATKERPLVSAEWHPVGAEKPDGQTVVHTARSDDFLLRLGQAGTSDRGKLKVWLIYADFLWSKPPRTWPKAKEWAGGILAFFEIDWATQPGRPCQVAVHLRRPQESTGFDWVHWVVRKPGADRSEAVVRLSNVAASDGTDVKKPGR